MLTLTQFTNKLEFTWAIFLFFLKAALNRTIFDNIEVISFVTLMEYVLTWALLHHFETINQAQLVHAVQALKQLDFVEVF